MANPNDAVRDAVLRHLHETHKKARSPKTAGLMISELTKGLKPKGYKQQEIASNLDYLVQKGWVREVVEQRSFTTPPPKLAKAGSLSSLPPALHLDPVGTPLAPLEAWRVASPPLLSLPAGEPATPVKTHGIDA